MGIHVMVNWQLSKRVCADQCYSVIAASSVQLIEVTCFIIFADQLLVLIDRRLRSTLRRPYSK